jgi:hypothetical protein
MITFFGRFQVIQGRPPQKRKIRNLKGWFFLVAKNFKSQDAALKYVGCAALF